MALNAQPGKTGKISHKGTKTLRKKDYCLFVFVPSCLGGENILFEKSFANMM